MTKLIFPLAAAIVAASLALPAAAQPDVAPVTVTKAPTTISVSIAGKDRVTVRTAVHSAAKTVCRNALANSELDLGDLGWCGDQAAYKAMKHYDAIVASRAFADSGVLILAAK